MVRGDLVSFCFFCLSLLVRFIFILRDKGIGWNGVEWETIYGD
jgi:hypothetical protein